MPRLTSPSKEGRSLAFSVIPPPSMDTVEQNEQRHRIKGI